MRGSLADGLFRAFCEDRAKKTRREAVGLMFIKGNPKTATKFAVNHVSRVRMFEGFRGEIVREVDADKFYETRDTDEFVHFATFRCSEDLNLEVAIDNFCKVVVTIVDVCCHLVKRFSVNGNAILAKDVAELKISYYELK